MLKWATSIRLTCFIALTVGVSLSCRKKIEHEPGMSTNGNTEYWKWVDPYGFRLGTCLEEFNGKLYAFSMNHSGAIYRIESNGDPVLVRTLSGVYDVKDMAVADGHLYFGGKFTTSGFGSYSRGLFRMSDAETFDPISFTGGTVYSLCEYEGDLIAGGFFLGLQYEAQTDYIDRIVGTTPIGFNGATGTRYSITKHNNELYSAGSNSPLQKWTGTNWETVQVPQCNTLVSIASYEGELYAIGTFSGTDSQWRLRKLTATGEWVIIEGIHLSNQDLLNSRLKVLNGHLFVVGTSVFEGQDASLLEFNGSEWRKISGFYEYCNDICYKDGYYYVVTNSGLFRRAA